MAARTKRAAMTRRPVQPPGESRSRQTGGSDRPLCVSLSNPQRRSARQQDSQPYESPHRERRNGGGGAATQGNAGRKRSRSQNVDEQGGVQRIGPVAKEVGPTSASILGSDEVFVLVFPPFADAAARHFAGGCTAVGLLVGDVGIIGQANVGFQTFIDCPHGICHGGASPYRGRASTRRGRSEETAPTAWGILPM